MRRTKKFAGISLPGELGSLATACGGAFGALSRAGIGAISGDGAASVLICNVIGAFTLSAAISFRARPLSEIENFISVGFCGGFSIFATFSKVSVRLLQEGEYFKFAANGGANLILCIWAVYLAEAAVTKFFPRRGNALDDDMMEAEAARNAAAAASGGGGIPKGGKPGANAQKSADTGGGESRGE